MNKLLNIVDGYLHLLFKDEKVEELAKDRALICLDCEHIDKEYIPVCGVCGCPIAAKTRAKEEECPKGKWNAR